MTRKEIISGLDFTVEMFLFDPTTGETFPEPRNDMDKITIDACRGAIKALEQEPCEYYDPEIKTCRRSEVPETGEWIDVKDRIPERTAWIICTDGKNISVEKYKKDGIDHFFPRGRWFDTEDMVAWMELPDPYKEESEE